MGLLDRFTNMDEDQGQGLLSMGLGMMAASGPSRTPANFGQIALQGLQGYQGSVQDAKRRKLMEEEAKQMNELNGMKLRDARSDFANQEALRLRATDVQRASQDFYTNQGKQLAPAAAAISNMNGPTVGNAAELEQVQAQPARQPSRYDLALSHADFLRSKGYVGESAAAYKSAQELQPKVKTWEKVKNGGKVMFKPYFEDGTSGDAVNAEVAEKLNFQDVGGSTVGLDAYSGAPVSRMANTQSPNNAATVGASYAQAAATREIATATRDAATIQRNMNTEMKMGDDYRTQSKGFKDVSDAYRTINATLDKATMSPAATLAGATKFMKLLDPGSVVRESELGMALAASGVFDRATNYHNTLLKGKVLTPNQVADFKNITAQIYGAAQSGQKAIDQSYQKQAETYGLRPNMVVQDLGQNDKPKAQVMDAMPKANTSNKGRTLQDDETGKRYKSNGLQWVEVK